MSGIISYPRCYVTADKQGDSVIVSTGDQTVQQLYDVFVNRTVPTNSWQFRKQVLLTALRLFGDFAEWLNLQSRNQMVVGNNAVFIHDTLNFIRTGQRELSVENWIELINETEDVRQTPGLRNGQTSFTLIAGETTVQLLQAWVAQPAGLQDLVCTLHVLFGQSRRTLD